AIEAVGYRVEFRAVARQPHRQERRQRQQHAPLRDVPRRLEDDGRGFQRTHRRRHTLQRPGCPVAHRCATVDLATLALIAGAVVVWDQSFFYPRAAVRRESLCAACCPPHRSRRSPPVRSCPRPTGPAPAASPLVSARSPSVAAASGRNLRPPVADAPSCSVSPSPTALRTPARCLAAAPSYWRPTGWYTCGRSSDPSRRAEIPAIDRGNKPPSRPLVGMPSPRRWRSDPAERSATEAAAWPQFLL